MDDQVMRNAVEAQNKKRSFPTKEAYLHLHRLLKLV
jgi:hypothetical protein